MTTDDWKLLMGGLGAFGAAGFGLVRATVLGAKWCLDRVREIVVEATVEIGKRVDGVKEEVGTMHSRINEVEGRVEVLEQYDVVQPPVRAVKTPKKATRPGKARK